MAAIRHAVRPESLDPHMGINGDVPGRRDYRFWRGDRRSVISATAKLSSDIARDLGSSARDGVLTVWHGRRRLEHDEREARQVAQSRATPHRDARLGAVRSCIDGVK